METCFDNLVEKLELGKGNKLETLKSIFKVASSNENINVDFKYLISKELVEMKDVFEIMKKYFQMEVLEHL